MKNIYEKSEKVLIWLGPDSEKRDAEKAVKSIVQISDYLCETLGCSLAELHTKSNVYREILYENRNRLPLPNERFHYGGYVGSLSLVLFTTIFYPGMGYAGNKCEQEPGSPLWTSNS